MKTTPSQIGILIVFLYALSFLPSISADEPLEQLNSKLAQRIELNKIYRDQFAHDALNYKNGQKLSKVEFDHGQEWISFLTYVKNSSDLQLKLHVLKLEYRDEIRGYYYDIDYSDNEADSKQLLLKLQQSSEELDAILQLEKGIDLKK